MKSLKRVYLIQCPCGSSVMSDRYNYHRSLPWHQNYVKTLHTSLIIDNYFEMPFDSWVLLENQIDI